MRVLIDHASPFLDAVLVVIGTGDVIGAWSSSQRYWMWSAWIVCAWNNLPSTALHTALQIQDWKFEPWRSEAEHATSQSSRLQCSTQYLQVIFTSERERKICFFESWIPERGTNPRSPDFSSRPLYNHCISPPPPPCPNCSNWEYSTSKERLTKMSVKKTRKYEGSFLLL